MQSWLRGLGPMCLWLGLGWGDWAQGLCSRSRIRRAVTGDSGPSSSALVFLPVLGPRSAWIFRHGPWDSGERLPLFPASSDCCERSSEILHAWQGDILWTDIHVQACRDHSAHSRLLGTPHLSPSELDFPQPAGPDPHPLSPSCYGLSHALLAGRRFSPSNVRLPEVHGVRTPKVPFFPSRLVWG